MFRKISTFLAAVAASALLAACGSSEPQTREKASSPPPTPDALRPPQEAPPYRQAHDLDYLMENVIEHNADKFWGSAGWLMNADGMHSLRPTTEESWSDVTASAATVAEMGNVLMTPPYSKGRDAAWFQFSAALVDAGLRAQAAAEARDEERIFETGELLYRVCSACHAVYIKPDAPAPAIRQSSNPQAAQDTPATDPAQ